MTSSATTEPAQLQRQAACLLSEIHDMLVAAGSLQMVLGRG